MSTLPIVEKLEATVYRVLLSATSVDAGVRNEADEAVKATHDTITALVEALEEARLIVEAMPISEMVGRIVGEDKVRTYEEARGIFIRSLSNTDAALTKARSA